MGLAKPTPVWLWLNLLSLDAPLVALIWQDFLARLAKVGGNVRFHGPYDRARVDGLMQSVHAVLVPSIWWENSPVVIQEALRNRRPIICSDIGGMAEKVRDGTDGFHFPVGSAMALTALLRRLAEQRGILETMTAAMPGHAVLESSVEDYMRLYSILMKANVSANLNMNGGSIML